MRIGLGAEGNMAIWMASNRNMWLVILDEDTFSRTRDCRKQHRILSVMFASVDTFQDHNLKIAMKLEFFLSLQMLTAWWQSAGQRTFTGTLLFILFEVVIRNPRLGLLSLSIFFLCA